MSPESPEMTLDVAIEPAIAVDGHAPVGGPSTVLDLRDGRPPTIVHVAELRGASNDVSRGGRRWQRFLKRGMDIVGASVLLVLVSPLLLLAGIAVVLTSSGGPIFACERIGRDGRPFTMYKIRSMVRGADVLRSRYEGENERSGPIFKMRRDPRITRVGRVLRKLSIDELPQLVNVLRGEMSLVGPRPPLPAEYERYGKRERQRLLMTPGMTGIWQVSGRSEVDFDEWVDMDLEYITSWSLGLDLKLLVLTIPAVLSGRGAY
jgi:lipopolysaccharide/colanic/teichoic acid biosynthesis glycosyltransferase